ASLLLAFVLSFLYRRSPRSVFRTTYTAVSEPGLGLPQFTAAAYVGDLPIARYDRLHTWQMMAGCEVGLDRPRGRYLRFGYDGSTYLSLEVETLTWTAADAMAQKMKRSWEANPSITQRFRAYVEKTCAEWSQARLDHGEEGLGRRGETEGEMQTFGDDTETLICRDHGFYPREIDMAWTRDGEVWLQDASHGVLAPNSDGTFYAWLSVRLDPWDRECFLCRVEHDALQTPVELAWEEPGEGLQRWAGGGGLLPWRRGSWEVNFPLREMWAKLAQEGPRQP
uniref:Ig-like domain-containing protein n=1 Tax=Varanus komodoensis TaxID=61221 RepID=A0A8D2IP33_VARKO